MNDIYILAHHADSVLFVSTDGGVYASINSGNHWERLGLGMPVIAVYDIDYDSVNHKLLAGTYARSLMSYNVDSMLYVTPLEVSNLNDAEKDFYKVFPNPANNQLTVHLGGSSIYSQQLTDFEFKIFDASGKIVFSNTASINQQQSTNNYSIDVSKMTDGVYYLVLNNRRKNSVMKFVVLH